MEQVKHITEVEVLRALAHPLRQRLLRLLVQLGPATVGTLTRKVDGDPGQVSYHLRKLAESGFIEEAPERTRDFRQRWWKAVMQPHAWSAQDFDSPAGKLIADTAKAQWTIDQFQAVREFEKTKTGYSPQWQRTATATQSFLYLTPEETAEMVEEYQQLNRRWAERNRATRDAHKPGAENVRVFYHVFPERP